MHSEPPVENQQQYKTWIAEKAKGAVKGVWALEGLSSLTSTPVRFELCEDGTVQMPPSSGVGGLWTMANDVVEVDLTVNRISPSLNFRGTVALRLTFACSVETQELEAVASRTFGSGSMEMPCILREVAEGW